jgi:C-terminal processing protease CtpA/Prc
METEALFPFDVIVKGERLFVVRDYQPTEDLPAGTEILHVNGMPAGELIKFLRHRLPTDGPKGAYADWILSTYFRAYYFFFFPPTEAFSLELKRPGATLERLKVKGGAVSQAERIRKERFPEHAAKLTDRKVNPIRFDVQAEEGLAVLSIRDFHRSAHRKAGQKFKAIIDEAMVDLANKKVDHLIIDLRDNQGGDLLFSHYLLRYLLEDSFQTVDHFAKVKQPEATVEELRLRKSSNRLSRKIKPRANGYRGKLYLLTNGGSFSNSGIFAWMIRKHDRGLILGSSTGGSSWSLCGGPNKTIRLPNSGIQVEIPTTRYALHPNEEMRGSVVPDIIVLPTPTDIGTGNDAVLNAVMTQIESAPTAPTDQ